MLWPRVGRDREADGCVVVARLTAVDHQGLVLTLSARLSKVPTPPEELDYKIVDDAAPPHARFRLAPRPDQPGNIIEARGAPSTSRDTLEASLDFVQPAAFLDRLLPPEG